MVQWYGKALELWLEAGPERNESVLNLAEDFFDALMVVHEANSEGRYRVTESFLHPVGLLAADTRVHIMIQKEAVRKLNIILDKIPPELKKERKMLLSAEVSVVMDKLASRILEGGDYDLQIALMEALCRMTSRAQRPELADRWFTMEYVSSAFCRIQDSEFETDCRKFLNLVNGMQGDKRRVYSYPCLEVFLGKHELLMPMDEKLEEFWIDFNLGSRSISFYFSLSKEDTQEGQWDTICIPENEVHSYAVEEARGRKVLVLVLTEPLSVGWAEGSELQIHFSQTLDVLQAAIKVYGNAKQKRFVGKTSSSVVKTTVQIILDESSSQVLVPESQASQGRVEPRLCGMEKNMSPLPPAQEEAAGRPLPLPGRLHPPQCGTPARRKVSESNTFVSSAGRRVGKSPSISVLQATTPMMRAKVKPALELVSSSGKKIGFDIRELMMTQTPESTCCSIRREQSDSIGTVGDGSVRQTCGPLPADKFHRNIPVAKVVEMVQTEQEDEEQLLDDSANMVPDSQPVWRKQRPPVLPSQETSETSRKRTSVSELALQKRNLPKARAPPAPPPPAPPLGASSALSQDQGTQLFPTVGLQKQRSSTQLSGFQLHAQLTQRLEGLRRGRERAGGSGGQEEEEEEEDQRAGEESQTGGRALAPQQRDAVWKSAQPMLPSPGACSLTKRPRKSGPVEVTSCMMTFISSQYKTPSAAPAVRSGTGLTLTSVERSKVGKSWTFTSMEKGTARISGSLKTANESNKPAEQPECDVYSFQSESPKSCGRKGLRSPEKSIVEKSVQQVPKRASPSGRTSTAAKPRGNRARKHLFSDTETEKTDISWLKESGRKPKPKVPPGTQAKQKKRRNTGKERKESALVAQLCGRPQRTTAVSKNYRELSESGSSSQSECEDLTHRLPKQNQTNGNTKWSQRAERVVVCQIDRFSSVSSTHREDEICRGIGGRVGITDLPLALPRCAPLSPGGGRGAFTGIQASSFYRSERGSSARKTPSAPSLSRLQAVPTPVLSPLHPLRSASPPLLTSTALEPSVPNSPFLEDSLGLPACLGSFKSSSSQSIPLPKLPSSNEQFKEHMSGPGLGRKRPPSHHRSSASEDEEEEEEEGRGSGTGQRMSMRPRKLFKAREEEEEEEEGVFYSLTCPQKEGGEVRQERGPAVAAPGQGESLTDAVRDAELCSVVSSRVVSSFWEANMEGDGDLEAPEFNASQYMSSMCRQFNSELQRKIQNRSRRMDHFAKQSLKTVQQHVSSVSVQIHQYRSQKLEKIRGVLLEEIHNLEKDNSDLKDVEKELTTYWRKQTQAFHSYQERESKR
ncbi:hypothetical protein ANANG_G00218190 [Anguilla anguilla]|uniref:Synaptonemal complex protein 2 Spt16M-like domain-containing protein n=1 Tax=Anguilla anguilla TaxID=7936 RepID=A0A9D3LVT8_ANGAN|nr:hypothetical protein ANANG_G00218190 [Anguilla anguilla]